MSGVYIHIPFCKQACLYCDFHFSTSLSNFNELIKALVKEIELRHSYLPEKRLNSIYFGGGTPSLLSGADLGTIIATLNCYHNWKTDAEVTLEANPDDIFPKKLKEWKSAGINRLSIGLQSFNNEELKWMNRAHTATQSLDSVKMAQDEGFDNITIDLIYGSKFQNEDTWYATLEKAISLQTQHISAYNLTIEQKTVLGHRFQKGTEPAVNDELSEKMFLIMIAELKKAGFIHYEISNFGKEGFFAKHNSNYWLQKPYLGLGPSAHSFNGVSRQWNVKNNTAYIKAIADGKPFFEKEELSLNDRYNEYVMTRLRTMWGCDTMEMRNLFGEELTSHFVKRISEKAGFIEKINNIYTLNLNGKLRADGIASDLFVL